MALITFLGFLVVPVQGASAVAGVGIVTSGLQMYWDARNPNSYSGSGTTWSDASGNTNTATFASTPSYTRANGGTYFTFSSTTNQYATVPSFNISFTSGFSTSFYADFGATADNWERIFDFGNGSSADNILVTRNGTTSEFWFEVYNGSTSKGTCRVSNGIATSTLVQWTITVSSSGICNIYKNGTSQTLTTSGNLLPSAPASRATNYIARSNWRSNGDTDFEGKIYALAIYNTELTSAQVTQNYNSMTDQTWPTLSNAALSSPENTTSVGTLSPSETSSFPSFSGTDSARFNVTSGGVVTFQVAPNYEAPVDTGANNVYDFTVRVLDANGNYNDIAVSITVTNVAEYSSITNPSLGASVYKGISMTITTTPSAGGGTGKITYFANGKRIPGCIQISYSGSGNSTCSWKPSNMGYILVKASFAPTSNEYAASTSQTYVRVLKRSTTR